jgi:hypothetical protein
MGLHKLEGIDYGPTRELRLLPTPLSPVASAAPKATPSPRRVARKLTFTVTNCLHKQDDLGYLFSVETSAGEAVASALLTPGDTTTSWTTEVALLPGDQVTWRARVVGKDIERAPVASITAIEAAEELNIRPLRAQQALSSLTALHLMEVSFATSDGCPGYFLTRPGEAYVASSSTRKRPEPVPRKATA